MNDKELADAVVALGVGHIDRSETFRQGMYEVPGSRALYSAAVFVRDPRVAMALMEMCQERCICISLDLADAQEVVTVPVPMMGKERSVTISESLPRAINEACVATLGESND